MVYTRDDVKEKFTDLFVQELERAYQAGRDDQRKEAAEALAAEYQRGRNDYRNDLLAQMDRRAEEALVKLDPTPKVEEQKKTIVEPATVEKPAAPEKLEGEKETIIRDAAVKHGIDPDAAATIARVERPTPPEGRRDVGGNVNPSRPVDLETNIELATMALNAMGGHASGVQIRNWVKANKWSDVPDHWNSSLYDLVSARKLSRDGINFTLPRVIPTVPVKAPAPVASPPPRPAAPARPPITAIKFDHNERSTMLASSRQYSLAGKLRAAMGKGHISEAFLAAQVFGSNTEHNRVLAKSESLAMNAALAEVGLRISHYEGYGLIMNEVS